MQHTPRITAAARLLCCCELVRPVHLISPLAGACVADARGALTRASSALPWSRRLMTYSIALTSWFVTRSTCAPGMAQYRAFLHGVPLQAALPHPPTPQLRAFRERCSWCMCEAAFLSASVAASLAADAGPRTERHALPHAPSLTPARTADSRPLLRALHTSGHCTCCSAVCSLWERAPPSPPSRRPRQSPRPGCQAARSRRR